MVSQRLQVDLYRLALTSEYLEMFFGVCWPNQARAHDRFDHSLARPAVGCFPVTLFGLSSFSQSLATNE